MSGTSATTAAETGLSISLLGGFAVFDPAGHVGVSSGAARLIAFLALRRAPVRRLLAAGSLWPDVTDARASSNLRSAIRRLGPLKRELLAVSPTEVALSSGAAVDLEVARATAERLIDPLGEPDPSDLGAPAIRRLSQEMLPGWYDDWTLIEAEEWRQIRLHALEAMSVRLCGLGRFAEATVAAGAAVRAEPLRETAQCVLIRALLAEGNPCEAVRAYRIFDQRLQDELGMCPSTGLRALVEDLVPNGR